MKFPRRSILTSALFGGPTAVLAKSVGSDHLNAEIEKALRLGTGVVRLGAGIFETTGLTLEKSIRIEGVPGHTKLQAKSGHPIFIVQNTADVSLFGLNFEGNAQAMTDQFPGLVVGWNTERLSIDACSFSKSSKTGVKLEECSGQISNCQFSKIADSGILVVNSKGMRIMNNDVTDIGNNGIQVWQHDLKEDGTQILGNRVSLIRAEAGGSGQNGNGIGIFNAGNVIVANNRVSDTAYSCIRCNSGSNIQIVSNSVSRSAETAIYVEFAFQGAVVSNNIVEDAAFGISITNFDVGGRMAVCTGNVVRHMHVGHSQGVTEGGGIHCEADTLIANNIIEDVAASAINLGWVDKCRNVMAQGNVIRQCARGISFSVSEGAKQVQIVGNMIEGARVAAVVGMKGDAVATGDFMKDSLKPPAHVNMYGNVVTG